MSHSKNHTKQFASIGDLKQWLAHSTSIIVLSVGVLGSSIELQSNLQSPSRLVTAIQCSGVDHYQGDCFVEYAESDEEDFDINYENFVFALCIEVVMASSKKRYGGIKRLAFALEDYSYLMARESVEFSGAIYRVLVEVPTDPDSLKKLVDIMKNEGAVFLTVPDGSGEITLANSYFGSKPFLPT